MLMRVSLLLCLLPLVAATASTSKLKVLNQAIEELETTGDIFVFCEQIEPFNVECREDTASIKIDAIYDLQGGFKRKIASLKEIVEEPSEDDDDEDADLELSKEDCQSFRTGLFGSKNMQELTDYLDEWAEEHDKAFKPIHLNKKWKFAFKMSQCKAVKVCNVNAIIEPFGEIRRKSVFKRAMENIYDKITSFAPRSTDMPELGAWEKVSSFYHTFLSGNEEKKYEYQAEAVLKVTKVFADDIQKHKDRMAKIEELEKDCYLDGNADKCANLRRAKNAYILQIAGPETLKLAQVSEGLNDFIYAASKVYGKIVNYDFVQFTTILSLLYNAASGHPIPAIIVICIAAMFWGTISLLMMLFCSGLGYLVALNKAIRLVKKKGIKGLAGSMLLIVGVALAVLINSEAITTLWAGVIAFSAICWYIWACEFGEWSKYSPILFLIPFVALASYHFIPFGSMFGFVSDGVIKPSAEVLSDTAKTGWAVTTGAFISPPTSAMGAAKIAIAGFFFGAPALQGIIALTACLSILIVAGMCASLGPRIYANTMAYYNRDKGSQIKKPDSPSFGEYMSAMCNNNTWIFTVGLALVSCLGLHHLYPSISVVTVAYISAGLFFHWYMLEDYTYAGMAAANNKLKTDATLQTQSGETPSRNGKTYMVSYIVGVLSVCLGITMLPFGYIPAIVVVAISAVTIASKRDHLRQVIDYAIVGSCLACNTVPFWVLGVLYIWLRVGDYIKIDVSSLSWCDEPHNPEVGLPATRNETL